MDGKTGDREILTLAQIDAAGELFKGGLPTEMGDAVPNDGRIQVLGDDVIHYDLSEDFIKKSNYIRTRPTKVSMRVLSDGSLYTTSGRILSPEERERQLMEELFAKENRLEEEEDGTPLSEVRPENVIRPGNPINMQVTDLNANVGTGPDAVVVRIESSSGDSVSGLVLNETGKHTAIFEGSVETARLPAQAFASDSSSATDPNQVISPLDSAQPWSAASDVTGMRYFGVDLNDLVALGQMVVTQGYADRSIKRLAVQTSYDNQSFTTLGAWPEQLQPWDGSNQVTAIAVPSGLAMSDYAALSNYIDVLATDPRFGATMAAPSSENFGLNWQDFKDIWQELPSTLPELPGFLSGDTRGANRARRANANKGDTSGNKKKKNKKNKKAAAVPPADVLVRSRGMFFVPSDKPSFSRPMPPKTRRPFSSMANNSKGPGIRR